MARQRIAVLFGGASIDNSVSLCSAYNVITTLKAQSHDVMPIGITRAGRWLYFPGDIEEILDGTWEQNLDCCSAILSPDPHHGGIIKVMSDGQTSFSRIDLIFSVLGGKYGDCGRVQSLCKLSRIPFVGTDSDGANTCHDRLLTHLMLNQSGITTPKFYHLERDLYNSIEDFVLEQNFAYPMVVKATSRSSSLGANLVSDRDELNSAIKIAFSHHSKAIVEQSIAGRRFECLVMGNEFSIKTFSIAEIKEEKNTVSDYIDSTSQVVFPKLADQLAEEIRGAAVNGFKALGCKTFARVSFTYTDEKLYCTKVSHMFGFSQVSMLPLILRHDGVSFDEFLSNLVELELY